MLEFLLPFGNLKNRTISPTVHTKSISDDKLILECIKYFNSEIVWDGMFTLDTAKLRLQMGEQMYVGYLGNAIFGYFWLKELSPDNYHIYNVFSKSTNYDRTYGATDMIYDVIKNIQYITINSYVDDWNIKSINVFNKLGFIQIK